ncbi:hypothetical protein [uncultured Ruegeria sp.]|uniref:hypothetical protein n=1 Tax=uncultured Ruegeria sp. TaxID=259304 RepID=UPI0026343C3A|nr:hypothetical protein [uncultured Ruegeria sp.]
MNYLFSKDKQVGLHRPLFVGIVLMNYAAFSMARRFFLFEWPTRLSPFVLSLAVAALLYGFDTGRRGFQCGPPVKNWILARKMVLTTFLAVLALVVFNVLTDSPRRWHPPEHFTLLCFELLISFGVSLILCRYAFVVGVGRAYSMHLRKKEQET